MNKMLIVSIICVLFLTSCKSSNPENHSEFRGSYMGQKPPADSAVLFAPGIISTGKYERDFTMSPDGKEIYYCIFMGSFDMTKIMVIKEIDSEWTQPEVAWFSRDNEYKYFEPFISPDGKKFFFVSTKPDTLHKRYEENDDIWVMDRENDDWGVPYNLGAPVNTELAEFFPSVTKDGTLYFTRDIDGQSFIFRSGYSNGKYSEPEKMNETINSTNAQFNAFIAPDESYIIVPTFGREESLGGTDYYICFNDGNDNWTGPVHMGDKINSSSRLEYSAYVSPDGKYLFFMSSKFNVSLPELTTVEDIDQIHNSQENGNPDIYWISADFIKDLRNGL